MRSGCSCSSEKTGRYRVGINGLIEGAPHGRYEVKVVALGAVSAADRSRLASHDLKAEAKLLFDRQPAESLLETIGCMNREYIPA